MFSENALPIVYTENSIDIMPVEHFCVLLYIITILLLYLILQVYKDIAWYINVSTLLLTFIH